MIKKLLQVFLLAMRNKNRIVGSADQDPALLLIIDS